MLYMMINKIVLSSKTYLRLPLNCVLIVSYVYVYNRKHVCLISA